LRRLKNERIHSKPNDQEPVTEPLTALPQPPRYLGARAAAEWRRVTKEMLPIGLLVALDRTILAAYCAAAGRLAECEHQLKSQDLSTKEGMRWLFIESMAMKAIKQFAPELGISPSARTRIKVTKPEKQDPFELFVLEGKKA